MTYMRSIQRQEEGKSCVFKCLWFEGLVKQRAKEQQAERTFSPSWEVTASYFGTHTLKSFANTWNCLVSVPHVRWPLNDCFLGLCYLGLLQSFLVNLAYPWPTLQPAPVALGNDPAQEKGLINRKRVTLLKEKRWLIKRGWPCSRKKDW